MRLTLDRMALTGLFMSIARPVKWKSCQAVNQFLIIFEIGSESNPASLRRRRVHELPDGGENRGDLLVMLGELLVEPSLELRESSGQLPVGTQQLAQLHEGTHHVDAHLDGAGAVQDGGDLDGAVLGKGEWELATASPT